MAPSHSRQLLVWSLPTIAVLLSYLWYKKRRIGARSDTGTTGGRKVSDVDEPIAVAEKPLAQELAEVETADAGPTTPNRSFARSLSGVETSPIDIVVPHKLRVARPASLVISDEDLDLEIEKIKSMKGASLSRSRSRGESSPPLKEQPAVVVKQPTPKAAREATTAKGAGKSGAMSKKKEMRVVEEKLTSLKLSDGDGGAEAGAKDVATPRRERNSSSTSSGNGKHRDGDSHRQSSERDSANHSPSDVMLASPSLSSISDNHSEGSSDSGKGGSDVATPPPSRTPGIDGTTPCDVAIIDLPTLYEFIIPQSLVGKLIGKHGSFVGNIKTKTNTHVVVKMHPTNNALKVCTLEGTRSDIDGALKMIREKFPAKRYSELTLEQVHFTPIIPTVSLIPDHLYLKLVEGINNDTILSCMVVPNHLFLQQPTHPSFPSLNLLSSCMNSCYVAADSPLLPSPVPDNTICAAYSVNSWCRAMVLSSDEETDSSYVKFLDYGGFAVVENSMLRQIRGDFMLLPFQAAECFLANIRSIKEDGSWPEEAYKLIADITNGTIIYTQVADYTEDGIPLVLCYIVINSQSVVFLNQHLVDNGFAVWIPSEEESIAAATPAAATEEGAVGFQA